MHSLKVFNNKAITEGAATEAIFNACRANKDRIDNNATYPYVRFERLYGDVWMALVIGDNVTVLAKAIIDEYDV